MLKAIRKSLLDVALAAFASLATPTLAGAGPERAGGVFPFGEAPRVQCKPSSGWTLADWRGRTVRHGMSAADGRVELKDLPCGYWTLGVADETYTVIVVPDPTTRNDDADGFLCVDSALSWISKPQFLDCPWHDGDTFRYVADLMRFAGIRRTRERLSWGEVQPDGSRHPRWSYYGENARRLKERDIAVCDMFQSAPGWAKPIAKLPGDIAALFTFCKAAAEDLDAMEAWEFWNEEIEGFAPEPAWDYAAAMKAAALGFWTGRPSVKILNGSLCFLPNAYDRALFRNEIGKYIDVVNIHAYPSLADYPKILGGRRAFAEEVGEGGKAIWTTECGTMALGEPALPGRNRKERRFSPEQELLLAEFYPKSQALMMMEGIARNYFFVFGAYCENGGKKDFSVIRRDGVPAPAFASISTATWKLAGRKLLGELARAGNVRAFLFEAADKSQTVLFWTVSPLDTASSAKPVSNISSLCEADFALPTAAGVYTVTDLCGTPSAATAENGKLQLVSTRFPQYVEGLRGLTPAIPAKERGAARRYEPAADEDLSIVIRAVPDSRDFQIGGIKSIAKLMRTEGRVVFEVWNLSRVSKRGHLVAEADGNLTFEQEEIELPPMGCTRLGAVYHPGKKALDRLAVWGVFNGKKSTALSIDIEPFGDFLRNCVRVPLAVDEPGNWQRNDSADEYACEKDEDGVKFTVRWNKEADRWFYPKYSLTHGEDPADAVFLVFEAKSVQAGGNNKYVCQNYWLDSKSGSFSVRHDLPPTGTEWTRYCLDLSAVENPRTGKVDMQVEKLGGIRLGGNPAAKELSFWVRKAYLLKRGN